MLDNGERPPERSLLLDQTLRRALEEALAGSAAGARSGSRLLNDARRTWGRVLRFSAMGLGPAGLDLEALETASYAIHLPLRSPDAAARMNLGARAEEGAELLLSIAPREVDEALLDRSTRVLREMPHRSPMIDEARILADAVNLDDFGITGLVGMIIQLGREGEGADHLAHRLARREQYGYWEARLKDGFHYEPVRELARRRLQSAREVADRLRAELDESAPAAH